MRLTALAMTGVLGLAGCGEPAAGEPAPGSGLDARPRPSALMAEAMTSPGGMVRALYQLPAPPTEPLAVRRYFTEEFVPGLAPPPGQAGPVNFDYRYGGLDPEILNLEVEETASGPAGARVEARFDSFGEPKVVAWDLCRRADGGWRVTNVANLEDRWSLRDILELPATTAGSC